MRSFGSILCILTLGLSLVSAAPTNQVENPRTPNPALREISLALDRAIHDKNWDEATAKVQEAEKLLPEGHREVLDLMRFKILMGKQDYPAAYALASKVSDTHKDNAVLQNEMAWQIATDKSVTQRNLALAETIATRGTEAATTNQNPTVQIGALDTLARIKFMLGKKDEAVSVQDQAVKLASGDLKTLMEKVRDNYKRGESPATK
jgi:hypothetical protein